VPDPKDVPLQQNPYLMPAGRQGWRGLSLPGAQKRKWFTLIENDTVLVTGLLLLPGEASVRHSHETGELSIAYNDAMRPIVTWHPPGEIHSGSPETPIKKAPATLAELTALTGNAQVAAFLAEMAQENRELRAQIEEMKRKEITPRIIIDILFPPFRTTVHQEGYPSATTINGQWYD